MDFDAPALTRTDGQTVNAADWNALVQGIEDAESALDALDTAGGATKLTGIEASADVTDATNVAAAGAVMKTLVDAKGDLLAGTADNTVARLAVGTDGQVLTAASGQTSGLQWATPSAGGATNVVVVEAATTAAGTLASSFENGDTVDGVTLATGMSILVKNQAAGADNGIYTVNASGAPTRHTSFDSNTELRAAVAVAAAGTVNAGKRFYLSSPRTGTFTVGTTAQVWSEADTVGRLVAGTTLGQVLMADPGAALGASFATPTLRSTQLALMASGASTTIVPSGSATVTAPVFWRGNASQGSHLRTAFDATGYTQFRLIRLLTVDHDATTKMAVRASNDAGATWLYADSGSGTTTTAEITVSGTSATSNVPVLVKHTSWQTLHTSLRADCLWDCVFTLTITTPVASGGGPMVAIEFRG